MVSHRVSSVQFRGHLASQAYRRISAVWTRLGTLLGQCAGFWESGSAARGWAEARSLGMDFVGSAPVAG